MFVLAMLSLWLYSTTLRFLNVVYLIQRSKNTCWQRQSLKSSAYNGVFWVNSLQCCVVRLLLWRVCMLQTGRGCRHKVLLSCGGITNDEFTHCGFFVCLLPCYAACFWCFWLPLPLLSTCPRVKWATFGPGLIGHYCTWIHIKQVTILYITLHLWPMIWIQTGVKKNKLQQNHNI